MNYDEFAFFNQQLAAMLREGIPLEGALQQLSAGMRSGPLRAEIRQLEADLARGTPLKEALASRRLPDFYRRMVEVGARSNDLPGLLILLADHYQRTHTLWTRLKGLMVYPLIVIVVSVALTLGLSLGFSHFLSLFSSPSIAPPPLFMATMWLPPFVLAALGLLGLAAFSLPKWRARLRWHLPGFREASLAQLASAMALMLKNGTPLAEALALAENLEAVSPAAKALAQWRFFVQAGQGKPTQWHDPSPPFPPLFLWLVQKGGEDAAAGFQKAADIFHARAAYRIELALYGALPVSILFLGQMIFWELVPLLKAYSMLMNTLGI
jgi:type II secretory pathway component PulF